MASEAVRRMFVSEFERNNGTRTKARKYESIMKSIILRERDHRFDEFITKFAKECIEEYKTKNELGILFGYDFDNKKGQDVEFFIDL